MNALYAFVRGLFRSIWDRWQENAETPKTVVHAETPPAKLEEFQDRIEEYKKSKDANEKPSG